MIKTPRIILVLGCICTLFLTSCGKKETMGVDNETQSVVDYAIADQEFLAIVPGVYQSILATNNSGPASVSCDTLIFISGNTKDSIPNTLYALNVSNISCALIMPDGKVRSGKLMIRLKGETKIKNSQITIKLVNYSASGIDYFCDSLVLTTNESNSSYISFNAKLINGSCKTGTTTINYKFDNRTMVVYPKGDATGPDAVTYIYGDASGTNRFGTNFSTSIVQETPIVKHKTCAYIDKGTMEITPQGFKPRTINFGNGVCDEEATFTVNENTVAFKLK